MTLQTRQKEKVKLCDITDTTLLPRSSSSFDFNPISAGVLENQDTLGGGQFDPPPSKSHV